MIFQQALSLHFKMLISNQWHAYMVLIIVKIMFFATLVSNKGARCLLSYLKFLLTG